MKEPLDIRTDFNRRAPQYADKSPWVRDSSVAAHAVSLLRGRPLGDVLDAGGGTGALAQALTEALDWRSALVVDASDAMLHFVPAHFDARVSRLEDLRDVGTFDTVLLRQVLHYLEDPAEVLYGLRRALRLGGRFYVGQIVAPDQLCAQWLADISQHVSPNRRRIWTVNTLVSLLADTGFRLESAAIHPFDDDVSALVSRSVTDANERELLSRAHDALTPEIIHRLNVGAAATQLPYTVMFFHSVFTMC
jgi:SAM-dependent methyltransferase